MLSEDSFHVLMYVLRFVVWIAWASSEGMLGSGGGWEYSSRGSLYFNVSKSSFSGRNENFFAYLVCLVFCCFV